MPKYTAEKISGDAGEYLVAYTVTRKLGWPCRLLGIDIGLDAEIEVLDDQQESNGDVIKVQVKSLAYMNPGDIHVYVDEAHIEYWKNFSAPIIVCCVDHSSATIYWQSIYQSEPYLSGGNSRRLTFNAAKSTKLDSDSKQIFRDLVSPPEAKNFTLDLAILKLYIVEWRDVDGIGAGRDDHSYIKELDAEVEKILKLTTKLSGGAKLFPFRFSPADVQDIKKAAATAKMVRRYIRQASVDQYY